MIAFHFVLLIAKGFSKELSILVWTSALFSFSFPSVIPLKHKNRQFKKTTRSSFAISKSGVFVSFCHPFGRGSSFPTAVKACLLTHEVYQNIQIDNICSFRCFDYSGVSVTLVDGFNQMETGTSLSVRVLIIRLRIHSRHRWHVAQSPWVMWWP